MPLSIWLLSAALAGPQAWRIDCLDGRERACQKHMHRVGRQIVAGALGMGPESTWRTAELLAFADVERLQLERRCFDGDMGACIDTFGPNRACDLDGPAATAKGLSCRAPSPRERSVPPHPHAPLRFSEANPEWAPIPVSVRARPWVQLPQLDPMTDADEAWLDTLLRGGLLWSDELGAGKELTWPGSDTPRHIGLAGLDDFQLDGEDRDLWVEREVIPHRTRVLDASGTPVAGATVYGEGGAARTDQDGIALHYGRPTVAVRGEAAAVASWNDEQFMLVPGTRRRCEVADPLTSTVHSAWCDQLILDEPELASEVLCWDGWHDDVGRLSLCDPETLQVAFRSSCDGEARGPCPHNRTVQVLDSDGIPVILPTGLDRTDPLGRLDWSRRQPLPLDIAGTLEGDRFVVRDRLHQPRVDDLARPKRLDRRASRKDVPEPSVEQLAQLGDVTVLGFPGGIIYRRDGRIVGAELTVDPTHGLVWYSGAWTLVEVAK